MNTDFNFNTIPDTMSELISTSTITDGISSYNSEYVVVIPNYSVDKENGTPTLPMGDSPQMIQSENYKDMNVRNPLHDYQQRQQYKYQNNKVLQPLPVNINCDSGSCDITNTLENSKRSLFSRIHIGRRPRTQYTLEQLDALENAFSSERYITRTVRVQLSHKFNMSEQQIKVWFQNRRMKEKKDDEYVRKMMNLPKKTSRSRSPVPEGSSKTAYVLRWLASNPMEPAGCLYSPLLPFSPFPVHPWPTYQVPNYSLPAEYSIQHCLPISNHLMQQYLRSDTAPSYNLNNNGVLNTSCNMDLSEAYFPTELKYQQNFGMMEY